MIPVRLALAPLLGLVLFGCAIVPTDVPPIVCDPGAVEATGVACREAVEAVLPMARADLEPPAGQSIPPERVLTITELRFRAAMPCWSMPGGPRQCPEAEVGRAVVVVTTRAGGVSEFRFAYGVRQTQEGPEVEQPLPYCDPPLRCDPD